MKESKFLNRAILWFVVFLSCAIIGITLCSRPVNGQSHHPDALYVSFQPTDLGAGSRYDYHIGNLGVYSSASYGNWYLYNRFGLKNHVKLTTGVLIPFKDYYNDATFDFTAGINYVSNKINDL